MTSDELGRALLAKAGVRLEMLEFLLGRGAYSDVVREAQELVELALKAMLRALAVDPPRWHDVGPVLVEHRERLPEELRPKAVRLAAISRWLRKERELAFYGDPDFIPTRAYGREEALRALEDAREVYGCAKRLFGPGAP